MVGMAKPNECGNGKKVGDGVRKSTLVKGVRVGEIASHVLLVRATSTLERNCLSRQTELLAHL